MSIEYDDDDHAIVVEDAATNVRREYDFDAEDRRVARRRLIAGALAASLSLITAPGLASDLESPHAEVDDATGAAQTGYSYEGEHAHAAYDPSTTDATYYLRDAMGSVIAVVNEDASDSARIHYDGFGNERRTDGPLAALPEEGAPRFQGMWREPDGLYYVRARNYDPQTGRFLSRDPADGQRLVPSSFSLYTPFANSPFWYRDPDGRQTATTLGATSAVASTLATIAVIAIVTEAACESAVATTGLSATGSAVCGEDREPVILYHYTAVWDRIQRHGEVWAQSYWTDSLILPAGRAFVDLGLGRPESRRPRPTHILAILRDHRFIELGRLPSGFRQFQNRVGIPASEVKVIEIR